MREVVTLYLWVQGSPTKQSRLPLGSLLFQLKGKSMKYNKEFSKKMMDMYVQNGNSNKKVIAHLYNPEHLENIMMTNDIRRVHAHYETTTVQEQLDEFKHEIARQIGTIGRYDVTADDITVDFDKSKAMDEMQSILDYGEQCFVVINENTVLYLPVVFYNGQFFKMPLEYDVDVIHPVDVSEEMQSHGEVVSEYSYETKRMKFCFDAVLNGYLGLCGEGQRECAGEGRQVWEMVVEDIYEDACITYDFLKERDIDDFDDDLKYIDHLFSEIKEQVEMEYPDRDSCLRDLASISEGCYLRGTAYLTMDDDSNLSLEDVENRIFTIEAQLENIIEELKEHREIDFTADFEADEIEK